MTMLPLCSIFSAARCRGSEPFTQGSVSHEHALPLANALRILFRNMSPEYPLHGLGPSSYFIGCPTLTHRHTDALGGLSYPMASVMQFSQ